MTANEQHFYKGIEMSKYAPISEQFNFQIEPDCDAYSEGRTLRMGRKNVGRVFVSTDYEETPQSGRHDHGKYVIEYLGKVEVRVCKEYSHLFDEIVNAVKGVIGSKHPAPFFEWEQSAKMDKLLRRR